MTYCMLKLALNTRRLLWLRLVLSFLGTVFIFCFMIIFYYANKKLQERPGEHKSLIEWRPSDPGYNLHVTSSAFEWLLAISLLLYFASFTKEFNKMKVGLRVQRHSSASAPFLTSTTSSQESIYT